MLDFKAIAADPEKFRRSLSNRGGDPTEIDRVMAINEQRKKNITKSENLKAQQNKVNQEIAILKRQSKDATQLLAQMKELSTEVKRLEAETTLVDEKLKEILVRLPNVCHESVPVGTSADSNKEVRRWGSIRKLDFEPKEHWALGENLGILDFEAAGRVTGARFAFLRSYAAKVERSLISFMLDLHANEHGYEEIVPPYIVNRDSLIGTGQLPKFEVDLFRLEKTEYFLIPTAEVPVTNYFREQMLNESDLPKKFVAFSPCFRAEAGSYGKDTKGLIRQHQFHKVELMTFSHPSRSYEQLEILTSHAEKVLQGLELPYRVMALSTGDIGFGSSKTYDIEVWLPGQNTYREISSCSNYEDFQGRRANIRFKPTSGGKPEYVHTLNGSGLAVGRTLVAILENGQQADGSIVMPKALVKYLGFDKIPAK